jgi:hypothetical protein
VVVTVLGLLNVASSALAAEPLPYTSISPAPGTSFIATQQPILWTLNSVPELGGSAKQAAVSLHGPPSLFDYFLLHETSPGVYEGYSHGGTAYWWNDIPGAYEWEIEANQIHEGFSYFYKSPVFSITVLAAPAPTPQPEPPPREQAPTPLPRPFSFCRRGFRAARIGGNLKCLHGGEFCARRYRRQYLRYHYACLRQGRYYRLVRF